MAFFTGRTVTAREVVMKSGTTLVVIAPAEAHAFREPRGTSSLYLPPEGLVSVTARGDALDIVGDLSRVDRPNEVTLSPIGGDDAVALAAALASRYELPRRPVEMPAEELASVTHLTYVRTRGVYRPGHFEDEDFEGVKLSRHDGLERGRAYVVEGFIEPRDDGPIHPGYNGAYLRVIRIGIDRIT